MSKPSLFIKKKLIETGYGDQQANLDQFIPIDYIMEWFDKHINVSNSPADRILFLKASTGSGKSTVIPPELFYRFWDKLGKRNICCTQPRVMNAISIPQDIVKIPISPGKEQLVLGKTIGYQTKEFKTQQVKGVVYMQINILPQQLNTMSPDDFMKKYSAIFIDEVHERSKGTDLAMFKMKHFILEHYKNPKCPFLVLMSATFDALKFCDYFLDSVNKPKRYGNIIQVEGLSFPIQEHWLDVNAQNCIFSIIETVKKIHIEKKEDFEHSLTLKEDIKAKKVDVRDIMIFIAGLSEINMIKTKLSALNTKDEFFRKYPILPIPLSSQTVQEAGIDYQNIFKPYNELVVELQNPETKNIEIAKPMRRVIIATNVGETGITVPTLKYVIDAGFYKSAEFSSDFSVDMLIKKPITQSMYKQRRGRCGRKAPGESYAMYTKEMYESMIVEQFPDILKSDITLDLLDILIKLSTSETQESTSIEKIIKAQSQQVNINIAELDLLDRPASDSLHFSIQKLFILGAIDQNILPTPVGRIVGKFRMVHIENIKMILAGYVWGVSISDLITIASCLNNDANLLTEETGKISIFSEDQYDKTQLLLADDFIFNLVVWNKLVKDVAMGMTLSEWSKKNGIDTKILTNISEMRDGIIKTLASCGLNPFENTSQSLELSGSSITEKLNIIKKIKQCIFDGYKLHLAFMNINDHKYETVQSHIQFKVSRPWLLNSTFIIYNSLLLKEDIKTKSYTGTPTAISVLDGFIPVDMRFDTI